LSFIGLLLLTGILGTLNNKSVAKSNTAPNIEVKQNVALASVSEKKIIEPAPAVVAPKPLTIKELIAKYFPENTKLAIAIADCESSFDPKQINEKGKDMSYGLFQINIKGKLAIGRPSKQELFNPEINVKTARKIYEQSGYTFKKDWVVCSQINQNLQ
jgi:soluble lytic murein transglycosylase-like protein